MSKNIFQTLIEIYSINLIDHKKLFLDFGRGHGWLLGNYIIMTFCCQRWQLWMPEKGTARKKGLLIAKYGQKRPF